MALRIVIDALLVIGAFFALAGTLGVLKMPDTFCRMQASTCINLARVLTIYGNGVYGVEATYNEYLKGTNGKYITAKDSVGKSMPFKYESYINAENGANLVVTIDLKIQYDLGAGGVRLRAGGQPCLRNRDGPEHRGDSRDGGLPEL